MSHPCNEYIIHDGVYVRDFEGMYKNFEDPWDQAKEESHCIAVDLAFTVTSKIIEEPTKILDVGCANGYHGERFLKMFPSSTYLGIDISPTIIKRAQREHDIQRAAFITDDVRHLNRDLCGEFDLVFSSKTLYYVAPEIDGVLDNIYSYLTKSGYLVFIYNLTEGGILKTMA